MFKYKLFERKLVCLKTYLKNLQVPIIIILNMGNRLKYLTMKIFTFTTFLFYKNKSYWVNNNKTNYLYVNK